MKRMIVGTIILIAFIISFVIGFAVFDEPISLITDTLGDAYPDDFESHDDVNNILDFLPMFFSAAVITGVIMVMLWYAVWGHKRENEKF